jgi:hypothetical protein
VVEWLILLVVCRFHGDYALAGISKTAIGAHSAMWEAENRTGAVFLQLSHMSGRFSHRCLDALSFLIVQVENFRSPNFALVADILYWLVFR